MSIIEEIAKERQRQIEKEGYTPKHDDNHLNKRCLTDAAIAYLCSSKEDTVGGPFHWPWEEESFKPTSPRRDLVKAAALIVAEIENLDRNGI